MPRRAAAGIVSPATTAKRSARSAPVTWAANAACRSRSASDIAASRPDHAIGPCGLVEQHGKRRDVGIPLDQGRSRPEALQHLGIERPDTLADPRTVIVDQDRLAIGV